MAQVAQVVQTSGKGWRAQTLSAGRGSEFWPLCHFSRCLWVAARMLGVETAVLVGGTAGSGCGEGFTVPPKV